jgi:hypothetical protein
MPSIVVTFVKRGLWLLRGARGAAPRGLLSFGYDRRANLLSLGWFLLHHDELLTLHH